MQTFKPLSLFGILFILITSGCTFSSTYLDREQDKKDATEVIGEFYYYKQTNDSSKIYALFSSKFYTVTSKEKLNEIFTATQNKLGTLKDTNLGQWQTKIVEGTNPSAEYALQYKNVYEKYTATETFRLMKDNDGKIRIVGYNISSDGFFK